MTSCRSGLREKETRVLPLPRSDHYWGSLYTLAEEYPGKGDSLSAGTLIVVLDFIMWVFFHYFLHWKVASCINVPALFL